MGHLRMEGQLFIKPCEEPKHKYEHFAICYQNSHITFK
ncbi:hypothetical protein [Candidatus Phytoplasma asteris]